MEVDQDVKSMLDGIVAKLVKEYEPHQIILYGSRAGGTPDEASDIDLFIVTDSSVSPYRRAVQVRRLLRDPQRRVPVDFLVVTPRELEERLTRGDQFLQSILAQDKVLYAS